MPSDREPRTYGAMAGGPLPRFLSEVLARITGKPVSVANIGKYLGREARKVRSGTPPGLVLLTVEERAAASDEQATSITGDKSG